MKSQPAVAWIRRKLVKLDSSVERLAIQEIFFLDFKLPDRKRHNTAVWVAVNFSETLFKTRYNNSRNILRDVYTEMKRRIRRVVSSSMYESRLHHGEWSNLAGSDSDRSSQFRYVLKLRLKTLTTRTSDTEPRKSTEGSP